MPGPIDFAFTAEEFASLQEGKIAGEKLGGKIDPDLTALKDKFEQEYWDLLQKKLGEYGIGKEKLLEAKARFGGSPDVAMKPVPRCISSCVMCVTACNAGCIASTWV